MSWTTFEDVQERWVGDDFTWTENKVETLILDAEDTILSEFPNIQDRIDDGAIPEIRVVKVAARMVIRHLRNPTGTRSTTQGSGPFQQSVTFGGDEPGALYLTDEDRRELRGSTQGRRAFMIDTTPDYVATPCEFTEVWTP